MKTIIFDMDGLMFDTERVFALAWDYGGEQIGIGKAGYMAQKTLGMGIKNSRHMWIEEFGDKFNETEIRRHTRNFLDNYYATKSADPKPGLYELLDYLKDNNYKIGLATSSHRMEVDMHLFNAKVEHYFQAIACGDMVGKTKPAPDLYTLACEQLGEKPCDCIALEDSKNGILSAYTAGCKVIMVPDWWQPSEDIAKVLNAKFDSLLDVITFLMNKNNCV